jgi:alkylation response protein AidB-like acyl-CoA dehydrogenase
LRIKLFDQTGDGDIDRGHVRNIVSSRQGAGAADGGGDIGGLALFFGIIATFELAGSVSLGTIGMVTQDTPLATMYMAQRTLRLADGPDEVHRMVVGRNELRGYMQQQDVNATFRDG